MFRRLVLAGLAILAAGSISVAAAEEKLVVMGTETLDHSGTGVSIDVSKAPGAYRGIRIRAKRGGADITRIQVIYSDGSIHNEDRALHLSDGERTRAINEGKDRFVDRVSISNKSGTGKATIEVLGIQTSVGAKKSRGSAATGEIKGTKTSDKPDTAAPGTVKEGNDVMFGYQNVGFGIDRDVIKVGGDLGKFDRIRLRVLGNDIHINSLKVVYVDGDAQDLAVDADIKANTKTRWFELKGDRFIREIQLLYRSKPNLKAQARVEVAGQYARGWLGSGGEGRKYNEGWVLLGAQTAGFTGFDRDTITVGENEGGFSRLHVIAKDRAITLREIRVKFFSGPDEVFTMRDRVDPDKPYGPLEFKGGKAPIKEIEARYRSRYDILKGLKNVFEGTPAVVQIWGQH
ncbi:MAG TPA: DUF2541 domain-containing protein [Hyphomicrobiaceae bacterium]|nr:DUF2541 domain-containing protein [Hyphomicrobiaceae bacterium]